MSTHYNHGSPYENHQRGSELHDNAAHAHRSASENHEKQDHPTGPELSRRALEHSQLAHQRSEKSLVNERGVATFGHDDIARLAHELWQARGCPEGTPEEDWFRAVQELRSRGEKSVRAHEDRNPSTV